MFSALTVVMLMQLGQLEPFSVPGYTYPPVGVWYNGGSAQSALPLGGLGTGFIDLSSTGVLGTSTVENNWLQPKALPPNCALQLKVGEHVFDLSPGSTTLPPTTRFWGHYPAADLDFGMPESDISFSLRAFSPFVPHDYVLSGTPAALFHFLVTNRGGASTPVEVGLKWQAPKTAEIEARGNVEGAVRWKYSTLGPGKTWTVTPMLVFAKDRATLAECARNPRIAAAPIPPREVPEGNARDFGDVKDFLLDAFGGFNWETHKRESAQYENASHIGQLFWDLSYDDGNAGRGFRGPYGFKGDTLPAVTQDARLQVRLFVSEAGPNCVAMAFTIKNISKKDVDNLWFAFDVNADIGGVKNAENQRVRPAQDAGGLLFEGKPGDPLIGLVGNPDEVIVNCWPETHESMKNDAAWMPHDAVPVAPSITETASGLQISLASGSYAIGAAKGVSLPGNWEFSRTQTENGIAQIRAKRTFAPGESVDAFLGISWYFPTWVSSDGETLTHQYVKHYNSADAVLAAMLPRAAEIENKIIAWQETIYKSPAPALLRDAVINGLYVLPRNSWWMDDGRFFQSESFTGCPITETLVCRYYGSVVLALLFPECERATMTSIAEAQKDTGEIPFAFGSPAGSRSPYYHVQHPIVSSEFALLAWRDYALWKQAGQSQAAAFLDEMYPRVKNALHFAMTLDKDADALIDEDPGNEKGFPANQYYDVWPWWGASAYTGGIWLAALRAGEELAKEKGDFETALEMRAWFERARTSYQGKLWNGNYYRLYNDTTTNRKSETSLTNALCGQWFAYTCGLGDILPRASIDSVINTVLQLNVPASPYGAVNGVRPDRMIDVTFPDHAAVITIGEVWCFAAMTAFFGRPDDGLRTFLSSYANVLIQQRTPWNIPWCLDPKTGANKWGINYYSNPCVWTLFQAVDPKTFAQLAKPPLLPASTQ